MESTATVFEHHRVLRVAIQPLGPDDQWGAGDMRQWRWVDADEAAWEGLVLQVRQSETWIDGARLRALCGTTLPPAVATPAER